MFSGVLPLVIFSRFLSQVIQPRTSTVPTRKLLALHDWLKEFDALPTRLAKKQENGHRNAPQRSVPRRQRNDARENNLPYHITPLPDGHYRETDWMFLDEMNSS